MKKYNVIRNLEPSTSIFTTEIDCKVDLVLPRCCTFLGIAILTFFFPESLLSLYYSCWLSRLSFWLIYSFFRYDSNINEGLLLLFSSLLVCSLDYYHFLKYAEATHHSKCGLGTSSMGVAWKLIQVSSVAQSCPALCNPMDGSMPGFPVYHQLPKLAQTHFHRVGDAIQPSCPLSSPSPPAFNLSQHQGLFKWVSSSHQVAKVLELQLQHQSFQWIFRLISFRMVWLDLLAVQGTLNSLLQHQFFSSQLSLWSNSHIHTWLLEKP